MIRLFRAADRTFGLTVIALSLCALGACQPTVKTADDFHQAGIIAIQKDDLSTALENLDQAVALDEALSEAYYNRANAHHNLGQFEAAVADYSKAIEQQADFAYAYVNRAINLEVVGEKEKAIADLTRAVEIFKQNGDTEDVERVTAKIELLKQSSAINQ